jgi:hypothetical protein
MAVGQHEHEVIYNDLDLPREIRAIEGPVRADLRAIASALSGHAQAQLLLPRRAQVELQARLWNRLTDVINETMAPYSAELR